MCGIIFDIAWVMLSGMYHVLIWLWYYLWHHMNDFTCDVTWANWTVFAHEWYYLWHHYSVIIYDIRWVMSPVTLCFNGIFSVMSHLWNYLWYHMSDVTCDITCVILTMITHDGWLLWRHMTCVTSYDFSYMCDVTWTMH